LTIDPEEFVNVWQIAECLRDVAVHFGISPAQASTRAGAMRVAGVALKKFRRGRKTTVDYEKLKKLIQEKNDE
jgi:transposase